MLIPFSSMVKGTTSGFLEVTDKTDEKVYQKFLDVAVETGAQIYRKDSSICNRVRSQTVRDGEGRPFCHV